MKKTLMIEYIEEKLELPLLLSFRNMNTKDLKILYNQVKKVKGVRK